MLTEVQKAGRAPNPLLLWFAMIAILVTGGTVQAQTAAGSVSGQISDPSGASCQTLPSTLPTREQASRLIRRRQLWLLSVSVSPLWFVSVDCQA